MIDPDENPYCHGPNDLPRESEDGGIVDYEPPE